MGRFSLDGFNLHLPEDPETHRKRASALLYLLFPAQKEPVFAYTEFSARRQNQICAIGFLFFFKETGRPGVSQQGHSPLL